MDHHIQGFEAPHNSANKKAMIQINAFSSLFSAEGELVKDSNRVLLLGSPTNSISPYLKENFLLNSKGVSQRVQENYEYNTDNKKLTEDLDNGIAKLKFVPYVARRNMYSEENYTLYNTEISRVTYETDDIYTVKLQKVYNDKEDNDGQLILSRRMNKRTSKAVSYIHDIQEEVSEFASKIPNERLTPRPHELNLTSRDSSHLRPKRTLLDAGESLSLKDSRHRTISRTSGAQIFSMEDKVEEVKNNGKTHLEASYNQKHNIHHRRSLSYELEASSLDMDSRESQKLASFEKAIHHDDKVTYYKLVKISLVAAVLISIVLFIYYKVKGDYDFQQITANVTVLKLTIERLFQVLESNRRASTIRAIEGGYMSRSRPYYTDFSARLTANFFGIAQKLSQKNNDLRNMLYLFHTEQQSKFYEVFQVNQVDDSSVRVTYENAFDLCSQLASSELRLYAALPKTPSIHNADLVFIFNNTMNGIVIHTESLYNILIGKDREIIQGMKDVLLGFIASSILIGIGTILFLIRNEVSFLKNKIAVL